MAEKKDTKERKLFVPPIRSVENYLNRQFDFRRNVITQKVEYKLKEGTEYVETNIDTVFRILKHNGFTIKLDELRSLFRSNFIIDYNPFQEHFDSLPEWDGSNDYIKRLSQHLKAEDQEFFDLMFKKTLVRCLACSLGGVVNRIVMVFVSKQELGKSWFLRLLNPFGDKYYTELPIREDKDTYLKMAATFIWNIEELASMITKEIAKLKATISMATIDERKPYAAESITQPRRCNFFGSTNESEFLTDIENTRWLPIALKEIDQSYSQTTNFDLVWSQAYSLYKQGFDYDLTKEEKNKRDETNKQYEISTPEMDMVSMYLQPCKEGEEGCRFMNYLQIADYLNTKIVLQLSYDKLAPNPIKIHPFALKRALKIQGFKRGIKRVDKKQVRGYFAIMKSGDSYDNLSAPTPPVPPAPNDVISDKNDKDSSDNSDKRNVQSMDELIKTL